MDQLFFKPMGHRTAAVRLVRLPDLWEETEAMGDASSTSRGTISGWLHDSDFAVY